MLMMIRIIDYHDDNNDASQGQKLVRLLIENSPSGDVLLHNLNVWVDSADGDASRQVDLRFRPDYNNNH